VPIGPVFISRTGFFMHTPFRVARCFVFVKRCIRVVYIARLKKILRIIYENI
jgi:hypothetical protein